MPHPPALRSNRSKAAIGIVALVAAGFTGHAGFASIAQGGDPVAPAPAPSGYEADDHFPGAAWFHLAEDSALPERRAGATGDAPLPDLPVPADAEVPTDDSLRAAPPFAFNGTALDRARAVQCLADAIYYEAASEPDDGQAAVAQVILNRVRHPAFPATVCGVIYQGSDKPVCQFSYACDGSMARRPSPGHWARARRAAEAALSGRVFAPVGMATHYHTYAVKPRWNQSLVMTGVFGAHFFHRWKGYWGTPGAFRQRHAGTEPAPGPLRRLADADAKVAEAIAAMAEADARALAAAPRAAPVTDPALIRPEHRASGTAIAEAPPAVDALPESTILDRWKDSGKPLR